MPSKPQSFNGVIVEFGDPQGTPYKLYATSWATSGGDRPEIDLTTSEDQFRYSIPGLRATTRFSFECMFYPDSTQTTPDTPEEFRNRLNTWKRTCTQDTLTIKIPDGCISGDPPTQAYNEAFTSSTAWVSGLTFTGSIDSPIGFSIEFIIG
tara:strand:+ start:3783 stop:4235 length:453 start_codon:yes stop_codon:yes gene_type:complete